MKKAIAVSVLCFILSCSLVSCGNNDKNNAAQNQDSTPAVTRTETSVVTTYTTVTETTESEKFFDKGEGDVSDHGVMPDETSPLEKIPEAAETAVRDAGDLVSDVIDDLT